MRKETSAGNLVEVSSLLRHLRFLSETDEYFKEGSQISLSIDNKRSNYIIIYNNLNKLDVKDLCITDNYWFLIMDNNVEIFKIYDYEFDNYCAYHLKEEGYDNNLTELYKHYLLSKNYVKNRRKFFILILFLSLLFLPSIYFFLKIFAL